VGVRACDKCGEVFDEETGNSPPGTVYLVHAGEYWRRGLKGTLALCEECADEVRKYKLRWYKRYPYRYASSPVLQHTVCPECGRNLVVESSRSLEGRRRYCSETCRRRHYKELRTTRRAWRRVCEACGEAFQARRNDAKTCSPKCRKRLERAKK
jgi:hypothetical protein